MASEQGGRVSWKNPELVKPFIDLCLEEVNAMGKSGSSLQKDSWDKIGKKIEEKMGLKMMQKQLRNEWDYLKKKYLVWSAIMKKTGNGYNPVTNTVNWNSQQWDDYIKANPEAKQFRHVGLQWANKLQALFDGISASGDISWGPTKPRVAAEAIGSSSTAQQTTQVEPIQIDCDGPSATSTPNANIGIRLPQEKRQKKGKDIFEESLKVIMASLNAVNEPSIDHCLKVLKEIPGLDHHHPFYMAASLVFTDSKSHREVWLSMRDEPDDLKMH